MRDVCGQLCRKKDAFKNTHWQYVVFQCDNSFLFKHVTSFRPPDGSQESRTSNAPSWTLTESHGAKIAALSSHERVRPDSSQVELRNDRYLQRGSSVHRKVNQLDESFMKKSAPTQAQNRIAWHDRKNKGPWGAQSAPKIGAVQKRTSATSRMLSSAVHALLHPSVDHAAP